MRNRLTFFFFILLGFCMVVDSKESSQTPPVVGHMPVFTIQKSDPVVSGDLKLGGVLTVDPTKLGYSDKDNDLPDQAAFQYRWEIEGRGVVSTTSSMTIPNELVVGGKLVTLHATPVSQNGDPHVGVPLVINNLNAVGAKMGDGSGRITPAKLIQVTAKSLRPNGKAISRLPIYSNSQLVLEGLYDNGFTARVTDPIKWTSSASQVITVSSTGKALAQSRGQAKITGQISGLSSTIDLTVNPWLEVENVGYFLVPLKGQAEVEVIVGHALNNCMNHVGKEYQIPGKPEPIFGYASAWRLPPVDALNKLHRVYPNDSIARELGWYDTEYWAGEVGSASCPLVDDTGKTIKSAITYLIGLGVATDTCRPTTKALPLCFVKW
ncbi:hypothetical protein ACEUBN_09470 [Aeromonas veronii]|uniref:hypothetical protein n=1 Tax=Aeromonas veronii TaxID=654 RepID=UPI0038D2DE62